MMPNIQSQYYTHYRQRHITEYSEAARAYRKNDRDEVNAIQRNDRRRNVELCRHHNENEYLGEIFIFSVIFHF